MLVGELASQTGASVRALRYYEAMGLVVPTRLANGYRDYDAVAVRQVEEIRALTVLGLSVEETRPFVECLASGHVAADDCPASLAAYRQAIGRLSARITALAQRRDALATFLDAAAARVMAAAGSCPASGDGGDLPFSGACGDLPSEDGGVAHLAGMRLPPVPLAASDGSVVRLDALGAGRTVLYVYPLTGQAPVDLPEGWDTIPGARGCTAEARGFGDHHAELRDAGAGRVYGLSSQASDYQRKLTERLRLPFVMLSDQQFTLRSLLGLPVFRAGTMTLYRRLTMIVAECAVEMVFYPVTAPGQHAVQVLRWLRAHPPVGR